MVSSCLFNHTFFVKYRFKALCILASIIGVSAYAPVAKQAPRSSSVLKADFKNAIGAQPPLGFFDPLGLLKNADQARFDRLRKVELKHGRIAMLAVLGHIVTAKGDRFPGEIAYGVPFSSVKSGLAAFENIPTGGLAQIIAFIGLMEWGFGSIEKEMETASCESYIGKNIFLRGGLAKKQAIELNNGRAAQMGILGLMVHEKLNNDPYVLNSLLGAPVSFN